MSVATITIALNDGSGCYAAIVHLDSFDAMEVARAAGEAGATLAAMFAHDRAKSDEPWEPELWLARHRSMMAKP